MVWLRDTGGDEVGKGGQRLAQVMVHSRTPGMTLGRGGIRLDPCLCF